MMRPEGFLCSIDAYVRGSCCYGRMCSMSQTLPESSVDRYPFTRPASRPPVVVETDGVELILEDGERVIDAAGGAVVTNIGHGRGEIADAVATAMRSIDYVVPTWATPNRVALVDRLVNNWLPEGFGHVYFAGGGSEATDTAVRVARQYHLSRGDDQRYKVIARLPSYTERRSPRSELAGTWHVAQDLTRYLPSGQKFLGMMHLLWRRQSRQQAQRGFLR